MKKEDRYRLKEIKIHGFKSIGKSQTLNLGDVNVLIGANGAGKSNLASFFQMLNHIATNRLQLFIGRSGYTDSLLYFGTKRSEQLKVKISCENQENSFRYNFVLGDAYQVQMILIDEEIENVGKDQQYYLGAGQQESSLKEYRNRLPEVKVLLSLLEGCRFISYISLYEFEALIFSDLSILRRIYFDNDRQIDELVALSQEVNPELINEDPETCPSKRIKKAIRSYNKRFAGSRVAKAIGLSKIRSRCKHFDEWIGKLERLAKESS